MQAGQLQRVSVSQIEAKLKSKKELYQFLVQDCSAYLPPIQSTNVYFFKAIMRGTKEYVKRDKVMVAAVPQIEGLTVEDLLDLARGNQALLKHLPDERDWVHIDRKWVCDILYTLDKNNFQNVINTAIKSRKERLENSRNLMVEMRPEFAQALNSCMNFSNSHGRSVNLMKGSSKRKRTREEIEEVKGEEEELKNDRQGFLQQIKRLKEDNERLEEIVSLSQSNSAMKSGNQSAQASKTSHNAFEI